MLNPRNGPSFTPNGTAPSAALCLSRRSDSWSLSAAAVLSERRVGVLTDHSALRPCDASVPCMCGATIPCVNARGLPLFGFCGAHRTTSRALAVTSEGSPLRLPTHLQDLYAHKRIYYAYGSLQKGLRRRLFLTGEGPGPACDAGPGDLHFLAISFWDRGYPPGGI